MCGSSSYFHGGLYRRRYYAHIRMDGWRNDYGDRLYIYLCTGYGGCDRSNYDEHRTVRLASDSTGNVYDCGATCSHTGSFGDTHSRNDRMYRGYSYVCSDACLWWSNTGISVVHKRRYGY